MTSGIEYCAAARLAGLGLGFEKQRKKKQDMDLSDVDILCQGQFSAKGILCLRYW